MKSLYIAIPEDLGGSYSQTGKTVKYQKYFWNVIVLKEKSQSGMRKLNCKQDCSLVCGFVASSRVLIFAVIGHDTINIPEIFQVFMVFPVALWNLQMSEKSISGKENHWAVVEELLFLNFGYFLAYRKQGI